MSEHQDSRIFYTFTGWVILLLICILTIPTCLATPWFHKHALNDALEGPSYVRILDYDADGDSDVVVSGGFANYMHWFENTGACQFEEYNIEAVPDCVIVFKFEDLDGDEDFDLVLEQGRYDSVYILLNSGNNEFTEILRYSFSYCDDIEVGDIDNDGDKDILLAGRNVIDRRYYLITWLENRNMEFDFVNNVIEYGEGSRCKNVDLVDIDNDNDLDIFAEVSLGFGYLFYYENLDNGNFIDSSVYWQPCWDFDTGDIDNDGDLDFVVGQYNDQVHFSWWENDGEQQFEENIITTFEDEENPGATTLIDIDSDGDLDIFGQLESRFNYEFSLYLFWYENDGLQDFTFHVIDTVYDYRSKITAGDLNEDGYMDLVNNCNRHNFINYYLCSPNDHQPNDFVLLEPRNRESYSAEQLQETSFSWEESSDADSLAEVMYYLFELDLYHHGDDTLIEHVQQVIDSNGWQENLREFFDFEEWEDNFLRINWKVGAISEGDTVECEQPFSIFIPEDVSVDEHPYDGIPEEWEISSLYPNPFNPVVSIMIGLPHKSKLNVIAFDVLGREVAVLADDNFTEGYHRITFDGSHLSSGIYFIRATVPGQMNEIKKVVLAR
ncbi:MAG: T9SS type A sorting domain-containing protein [Candidatus Electryonea clarkiae]|nr:T9SS type A sorting domain-containing protein [Candidatus Electryonea clarkiae]MDP8287391.1 T9SS type A sorting domain-containing protein [Candidatus Electryonea clarkiae]